MAIVRIVGRAIALAVAGAFLGVVLYLVNLPFVLLANRCPLYRRRLCQVLQFSEEPADAVEPIEPAEGSCIHSGSCTKRAR